MASELAALKEEKVILTKKVHAGNASIEKFKTSQQQSALKQKTLEVEVICIILLLVVIWYSWQQFKVNIMNFRRVKKCWYKVIDPRM